MWSSIIGFFEHVVNKVHQCFSMYLYSVPFYCQVIFHCINIPHFVSSVGWRYGHLCTSFCVTDVSALALRLCGINIWSQQRVMCSHETGWSLALRMLCSKQAGTKALHSPRKHSLPWLLRWFIGSDSNHITWNETPVPPSLWGSLNTPRLCVFLLSKHSRRELRLGLIILPDKVG